MNPYSVNDWLSRRCDKYVKSRKTGTLPKLWWALQAKRNVIRPMMQAWRKSIAEWKVLLPTDPYGALEFAAGDGDDFVCFDYHYQRGNKVLILHAVVNSETGSFVQNFIPPFVIVTDDADKAYMEAYAMVCEALDWCVFNEVDHDFEGWNQDPFYFARAVRHTVANVDTSPIARRIGKECECLNA